MKMQTRTHGGQVFPFPRPGETVYETPPSFLWVGEKDIAFYRVEVRDEQGTTVWTGETERNAIIPDEILPPGNYTWNVYGGSHERGWQAFSIAGNAVKFLRPTADDVLAGLPTTRPRHLFCESDLPLLRRVYSPELETLRRNVKLAMASPPPTPPDFHITNHPLGFRVYFGAHRDVCDRDLVALSLGAVLLEDDAVGEHAKKLFLTLCGWNPDGPCSPDGSWGDEIGLSHIRCFPAVLDLLWPRLSERERGFAARTLATYASLCEKRLLRLDFFNNPGDSHCGRLPAYLGEAALVLAGTGTVPDETIKRWLNYALDIYGGLFPHFGGVDGGWAEGTFYASSYTKWYLPFFSAVARYSGKNFLDRPFYQNLVHFFLHFAPPGWESHPFCDGYWCRSDDAEWPGFFAQNPYRVYAQRSGISLAHKYVEELRAPEIFKLHLLDVFLPPMKPPEINITDKLENARAFPDSGFVSLHTNISCPQQDTVLLARASPFGCVSHQHADQGNFALIHKGRTLISPSGYFGVGFGSHHHHKWTRTTFAHNCVLIDGQPQPMDYKATARVLSCKEEGDTLSAELDLAAAYPMLISYVRSFTLNKADLTLTVRDTITADKPVTVSFLNHTLSKPEVLTGGRVAVERGDALIIMPKAGLLPVAEITDKFAVDVNDGVPEEYWVEMPQQYHLRWESETAKEHEIVMEYNIQNPSSI